MPYPLLEFAWGGPGPCPLPSSSPAARPPPGFPRSVKSRAERRPIAPDLQAPAVLVHSSAHLLGTQERLSPSQGMEPPSVLHRENLPGTGSGTSKKEVKTGETFSAPRCPPAATKDIVSERRQGWGTGLCASTSRCFQGSAFSLKARRPRDCNMVCLP